MNMKINNEVYDKMANSWWDDDACGSLSSLRFFVNEIRLNYINTVLSNQSLSNTHGISSSLFFTIINQMRTKQSIFD